MTDTIKPIIQRATLDDIDTISQLMNDFYTESQHRLHADWAKNSIMDLISNPAHGCLWLIIDKEIEIGYIVLTVRHNMEFGGLSGYIDDLYVKPEFRRHGAASKAIETLIAECRARGCKSIHVEVSEFNEAARAIYSSYGLLPRNNDRLYLSIELRR